MVQTNFVYVGVGRHPFDCILLTGFSKFYDSTPLPLKLNFYLIVFLFTNTVLIIILIKAFMHLSILVTNTQFLSIKNIFF